MVGQCDAGAGLGEAGEDHGEGFVDQTEASTTLGDAGQVGSRHDCDATKTGDNVSGFVGCTGTMEGLDPSGDVHGFQTGHHGHVGAYRLARQEAATDQEVRVYGSALERDLGKVEKITTQLTKEPNINLDHRASILEAATMLNNLRFSDTTSEVDLEEMKQSIQDCTSLDSVLDLLWNYPAVRGYFMDRENSSHLEDFLSLSGTNNPLTDFPPDINTNVYSSIISFGIEKSRGIILLLLKLLAKKDKPVLEKEVIRISFMYSLLAHGVCRNNNALAKTKSLLLQAQGITVEGLNTLSFLGICEAGNATRKSTDLLAEVTDSLLRMSCKTHPTQTVIDNLGRLSILIC